MASTILKVYDNFHYMDEDEVYWRGPLISGDTALAEAMAIVDGSLGRRAAGKIHWTNTSASAMTQ